MIAQRQIDFDSPLARRSDPQTSKEAAERIAPKLSQRRAECYAYIVKHPGCVGSEIEAENPQWRKRIRDLEAMGLIVAGPPRESHTTGYSGVTWHVTNQPEPQDE